MSTSSRGLGNKRLRQVRGPAATVFVALFLLLGAGLVAQAAGPTPRWHVVQGSDGTLYLLSDSGRYTLQVDPISDEDLAALPDAGPIGPLVGAPPAAASAAAPKSAEPAETTGDQSLTPPPESAPVALPEASPTGPAESAPVALPEASPTGPPESAPVALPEASPTGAPESVVVPPLSEPTSAPPVPPVPEVVPPPVSAESAPATISGTPPALAPLPPSAAVAPASSSGQASPEQAVPPRSVVPPALATSLPAPPQSLGAMPPIAPTPTPTATLPASAEAPVLLSGSGTQTTRTFSLRGGTYSALWTSTTPTSAADTFAAILRPSDPGNLHTQVIGTALVPGSRSISGQTQITSLPSGTYSVEIVGGTNWTLSISVQSGPGVGRP